LFWRCSQSIRRGLSLQNVAGALKLPKSSTHRLLTTWTQLGYVERLSSGRFRLGFRIVELGRRLARGTSIVERARSALIQLHQQFDESVYLGLYRGGKVILVDAIESTKPLRVAVDLGEKCWLHASAQGRCVAAWLSEQRLEELLAAGLPKITRHTIQDRARLSDILASIRANGYCINLEETVEGSVCLGAPYFAGCDGPVLGSLGIAIPSSSACAWPRVIRSVNKCRNLSSFGSSQ
jgi:DNA-binding IclR family transcriptional regulator